MRPFSSLIVFPLLIVVSITHGQEKKQPDTYDVVVYGGTSAGIAAAVQVKRMGGTVIVIEPSNRIGGLTTGGLGQTDIGNKSAIGGIAREFYQRIKTHYQDPKAWKWQKQSEYRSGGQSITGSQEDTMWTFEPSVALSVMQGFVDEYDIPVVYQQRLDRSSKHAGVSKDGSHIVALKMHNGKMYSGRVFIDATYEGDLMAAAGVSYTVGRESNEIHGETLNGVQTKNAKHHQLATDIDPYKTPGDKSSGLLPGIDPNGPGTDGAGDQRVQAYCFRMCITDRAENRIEFKKPDGYDPLQYELLLRNFEAGEKRVPLKNSPMPNRKTDTNNNFGFSTDYIGQNYAYPDASYSQREEIIERHRIYQQGLMWTLANHPRVPKNIRIEVSRWGTCKDEFERADGWQQQLYIREARRMIGEYVMTQHNCQGRRTTTRSIGLAAYTMDSHNVQRYIDKNGHVRNEGDVQVGGFPPYPIDFGAIVPKKDECDNLVVPVCLSASHIAFGSIRMEPVFMVLGQSGATAAMHAARSGDAIQDIDSELLQQQLLEDKQRLYRPGAGIKASHLQGLVVDDSEAELNGFEHASASVSPYVEKGYRHDNNENKGKQNAIFEFSLSGPGRYEVLVSYSPHANRATNVPVKIESADGVKIVKLNQRKRPFKSAFSSIGDFTFEKSATVTISNDGTDGFVVIDAVQLIKVDE